MNNHARRPHRAGLCLAEEPKGLSSFGQCWRAGLRPRSLYVAQPHNAPRSSRRRWDVPWYRGLVDRVIQQCKWIRPNKVRGSSYQPYLSRHRCRHGI